MLLGYLHIIVRVAEGSVTEVGEDAMPWRLGSDTFFLDSLGVIFFLKKKLLEKPFFGAFNIFFCDLKNSNFATDVLGTLGA